MNEAIRARALALGFDACRFTTAAPPPHGAEFKRWLGAGHGGTMAYLARGAARRLDPQRLLPGARSVVTLAASYHHAVPPEPNPAAPAPLNGIVARYARQTDYHHVLAAPLDTLVRFIRELGGGDTLSLAYTDTGPILERDLAERAGLGFIGKHTNLIGRTLGNWFFLAEIITTLDLTPDSPETNHCGSCTRCLAACPTQAIPSPFVLNARRCISYLTIEFRGSIPVEFRSALGVRIFGCDDCLAVCPWNRFAREGALLRSHRRADLGAPSLLELLALDAEGFHRRFAGTPLERTGHRGLQRNVCVALGNAADATALPALRAAASSADPLIAEHAAWAVNAIHARPDAR